MEGQRYEKNRDAFCRGSASGPAPFPFHHSHTRSAVLAAYTPDQGQEAANRMKALKLIQGRPGAGGSIDLALDEHSQVRPAWRRCLLP